MTAINSRMCEIEESVAIYQHMINNLIFPSTPGWQTGGRGLKDLIIAVKQGRIQSCPLNCTCSGEVNEREPYRNTY